MIESIITGTESGTICLTCGSTVPCLTKIIEALEAFQSFEPDTRAAAIALFASDLGIAALHFYAIALYAGLGGAQ
jgi:hypothetical protein